MDHTEAFLHAICEDADNDALRQIYADWLEENGTTAAQRALAEFIRVQIELAGIPELLDRALLTRWKHLYNRQDSLLELHRADWLRRDATGGFPQGNVTFRRGFASEGFLFGGRRVLWRIGIALPLGKRSSDANRGRATC